jgi:Ferritin-like
MEGVSRMKQSPITTRAELLDALRVASELEHGLMAQYLFAVYSLKRYTWEGLEPVQLERVRRWSSSITLIARQEMEHLGLALNLISAIGGTPSFSRPNMPQRADYYGKAAGIELTLTRGDLDTIKRFQRFEAPDALTKKLSPGEPVSQKKALAHCAEKTEGTASPEDLLDRIVEAQPKQLLGGAPVLEFRWASVQELYMDILHGFEHLTEELGESGLFVGSQNLQIFGGPASPLYGSMNDLNQYDVDLIGVTNLATARQAIRMILEQGEGVPVVPQYLRWTHFCLFTEIRREMEKYGLGDLAARPVVPNPMVLEHPDVHGTPTILTNEPTREIAQLFNGSYELMLLLLLYLYSDNVKTQKQVNSLMDAAFFPLMTMFVRPLAEILTEIPAFRGGKGEDGLTNAGPGFELNGDVLLLPASDATWGLFQERIDTIVAGYGRVLSDGDPWIDLPGQREPGFRKSRIWRRLEFTRDNMKRLSIDWRNNWLNIGLTG